MNNITIGSTTIDLATYTPTQGADANKVDLNTLKKELSSFPDLISSLIRMIAGNNAKGEFDLDVSHTRATLILGSVTTIISMENGAWTKKVGNAASTPVFENVTDQSNYTRLTTLFIKTMKDSRHALAAQPASSHPAAASTPAQTSAAVAPAMQGLSLIHI